MKETTNDLLKSAARSPSNGSPQNPKRGGSKHSKPHKDPVPVTISVNELDVLEIDPNVAEVLRGGRIRFVCEQTDVVIIAQFSLKGHGKRGQTPFANDAFSIVVPKGKQGRLAHIKDEEDLPLKNGQRIASEYEYAVVALGKEGGIIVADPIIIIR
jgi:hypothetical protein